MYEIAFACQGNEQRLICRPFSIGLLCIEWRRRQRPFLHLPATLFFEVKEFSSEIALSVLPSFQRKFPSCFFVRPIRECLLKTRPNLVSCCFSGRAIHGLARSPGPDPPDRCADPNKQDSSLSSNINFPHITKCFCLCPRLKKGEVGFVTRDKFSRKRLLQFSACKV